MRTFICAIALLFATTAFGLDRTATFEWDSNVPEDNVTAYLLERSQDQATWTQIGQLDMPATDLALSDTLTGVTGNYYYRVLAQNAWGVSGPSNVVELNTATPGDVAGLRIRVVVDVEVP